MLLSNAHLFARLGLSKVAERRNHQSMARVQVYVQLVGESGTVGEQKLRNNNLNQFERNQKDEFIITGGAVGKIKQVILPTTLL